VKFNAKDALRMLSEGFDKNYLIRGVDLFLMNLLVLFSHLLKTPLFR
jgi:hypothetical protein